jgi:hypothetical protein
MRPIDFVIRKKTLQKEKFELVVGDVLTNGKHWPVDSTKLVNSPRALLMNITLGAEVGTATLATRQPNPGEAVIIILLRPGEKTVRGDCFVDSVANGAFRLKCSDGMFYPFESWDRKLVFSRLDGTLVGFSSPRSDRWQEEIVAIASILDDLPQLGKLAGGAQGK